MHYIQLNIGRNVASTPMSDAEWRDFKTEVSEELATFAALIEGSDYVSTILPRIECHEGIGTWDGIQEQSAHLSILIDVARFEGPQIASALTDFRGIIREIGRRYGQDEIGFISGTWNIKIPARA